MQKLLTLLSGLLGNIDKTHDRVTAGYNLWLTIYGFIASLRGDVQAVPVPEAVRGAQPAPVAASVVLEDPGYAAAPAPAPAVLADADYQAHLDERDRIANGQ